MKDLITLTIVGILLYLVAVWPDIAWADLVIEDGRAMILLKVFSF